MARWVSVDSQRGRGVRERPGYAKLGRVKLREGRWWRGWIGSIGGEWRMGDLKGLGGNADDGVMPGGDMLMVQMQMKRRREVMTLRVSSDGIYDRLLFLPKYGI